MPNLTDQDRADFLKALDKSRHDVSDFEAKFIESNMDRDMFSLKQREIIDQMMKRYPDV